MWDDIAQCNLHASFEGLCYCHLRLPHLVCACGMCVCAASHIGRRKYCCYCCPNVLSYVNQQKYLERQLAQLLGALLMIAIGLVGSFIMYFILYIIPIKPFVWLCNRYVLQVCSAGMFCRYVLQVCSAGMFCRYVLQVCSAGMFCRYVLQVCSAGMFCRYVLQVCSAGMFCRYVLQVCSAGMFCITVAVRS